METKYFTLVELLKSREWLMSVMNSTSSFVTVPISKEHIKNARLRLREIDQELVDRLMDNRWQTPFGQFCDEKFEDTIKKVSNKEKSNSIEEVSNKEESNSIEEVPKKEDE